MTVADLRKALEDMDDELEVGVELLGKIIVDIDTVMYQGEERDESNHLRVDECVVIRLDY